jgi:hypothetical protein
MKRIIVLVMILAMMLASIGGCCALRAEDGTCESYKGRDRNKSYENDYGHDLRNTINKLEP